MQFCASSSYRYRLEVAKHRTSILVRLAVSGSAVDDRWRTRTFTGVIFDDSRESYAAHHFLKIPSYTLRSIIPSLRFQWTNITPSIHDTLFHPSQKVLIDQKTVFQHPLSAFSKNHFIKPKDSTQRSLTARSIKIRLR